MSTESASIDDAATSAPEQRKQNARRLMAFGMVVGFTWAIGWGVAAALSHSGLWWAVAGWGLVVAGWCAARFAWISRHWPPTDRRHE